MDNNKKAPVEEILAELSTPLRHHAMQDEQCLRMIQKQNTMEIERLHNKKPATPQDTMLLLFREGALSFYIEDHIHA
jgi:hypothetical protein